MIDPDAVHYALAGTVVPLAGAIVGVVKYGFATIQRAHEERIKEQKAWARKVEQTLVKVLPLAEALSGIAGDFLTFMEGNKDEEDAEAG